MLGGANPALLELITNIFQTFQRHQPLANEPEAQASESPALFDFWGRIEYICSMII
jgi:hypothetical protein